MKSFSSVHNKVRNLWKQYLAGYINLNLFSVNQILILFQKFNFCISGSQYYLLMFC